jgi:hypothetical protein
MAFDIPETVPVKVGDAVLAFRANAEEVAVETGLLASEVLSTFPRPTMAAVMPETVPVKVGEALSAFKSRALLSAFETRALLLAFKSRAL